VRIAIWQQWASNHSAAFTIMGKFQTAGEAQRVGSLLQDMLRQIAAWKQQDRETKWQAYLATHQIQQPTPNNREAFDKEYYGSELIPETTEIERRLAEQHNITWINTVQYAEDPAIAPHAVFVVDRVVIVAEDLIDYYTWTGFWPFEELMSKLGGEVALQFEFGGTIQVILRCVAPDETTAIRLFQEVEHQVAKYDTRSLDMIFIEGLGFEGKLDWVPGSVTSEGLTITYTFEEWCYGRFFAGLIEYLRSNGCTSINYTFETRGME